MLRWYSDEADYDFKEVDGAQVVYWPNPPLVHFLGTGSLFELPGYAKPTNIENLLAHRDILLFCERSGGARVFTEWLKEALDTNKMPYLSINCGYWGRDQFETSEVKAIPDKQKIEHIKETFFLLNQENISSGQITQYFETIQEANGSRDFLFIVYEPTLMKAEACATLVHSLRGYRDSESFQNLKFLFISSRESLFTETLEASGYLHIAQAYRYPRLSPGQSMALLKHMQIVGEVDESFKQCFWDYTGGQPFLVQGLAKKLGEFKLVEQTSPDDLLDFLEIAYRRYIGSPPDVVQQWQADLRHILQEKKDLVETFRAYVRGDTVGDSKWLISLSERPLAVSGWLGLNRLGRWGIASEFHAHFGRLVLTDMGVTS